MTPIIRFVVDADRPDPAQLARAAAAIHDGGVVAIPTDTLYGLAADAFNAAAVGRVFAIKGGATERALPLVASDLVQVRRHLGQLTPIGARLAERLWPGPLTIVMRAPESLGYVSGGTGLVGVRVPAHAVTRALCAACNTLLTATSANISGQPPTDNPDDVMASLGSRIDGLVDAGRTRGGPPSTVVDVTAAEPHLIRAGAISWDDVQACALRA